MNIGIFVFERNSNGIFALPRRLHPPQRPPAVAPPCSQRAVATHQRGPQHGGARLWRVRDRRRRMR